MGFGRIGARGGFGSAGALGGASWVLSPGGVRATRDRDFSRGLYFNTSLSALSVTRAISGTGHTADYAPDILSNYSAFAANIARVKSGTGLLVEESRADPLLDFYDTGSPITFGAVATDYVELLSAGGLQTSGDFAAFTVTNLGGSSFAFQGANSVRIIGDTSNIAKMQIAIPTPVIGQRYTLRVAVSAVASGTARLDLGSSIAGSNQYVNGSALPRAVNTFSFVATTTTAQMTIRNSTAAAVDVTLFSISMMLGGLPSASSTNNWAITAVDLGNMGLFFYVDSVGMGDHGLPEIGIRVRGTNNDSSLAKPAMRFNFPTQIAASNNQVWVGSVINKVGAGSNSGFNDIFLGIDPVSAGGTSLSGGANMSILGATSARQRTINKCKLNNASTANTQLYIEWWINPGATVDLTLKLSGHQFENTGLTSSTANAIETSPMVGTSATVTRNADVVTEAVAGLSAGAVMVGATTPSGAGTQTIWSWHDGTANNQLRLYRNSTNEIHFVATSGGVDQCDLNLGTVANSTTFKAAFRWGTNDFAGSLNGAAVVTDTSGSVPTGLTTKQYGSDTAGNYLNKTITRAADQDTGWTNSQLQLAAA